MQNRRRVFVNRLKDCVRLLEEAGCKEHSWAWKDDANKILLEWRRLGYSKQEALDGIERWAKKSGIFSGSMDKEIRSFAHWRYEKPGELGCRSLRAEDLCFKEQRPDGCPYNNEYQRQLEAMKNTRIFSEENWPKWRSLFEKEDKRLGGLMVEVYEQLRRMEFYEAATVFVSYRGMAKKIELRFKNWHPSHTDVLRALSRLQACRLVIKVFQGKPGVNSRLSNGYCRALPVPPPPNAT